MENKESLEMEDQESILWVTRIDLPPAISKSLTDLGYSIKIFNELDCCFSKVDLILHLLKKIAACDVICVDHSALEMLPDVLKITEIINEDWAKPVIIPDCTLESISDNNGRVVPVFKIEYKLVNISSYCYHLEKFDPHEC